MLLQQCLNVRHNKGAIETVYLRLWNLGLKVLPRVEQCQDPVLLQDSLCVQLFCKWIKHECLTYSRSYMSVDTTVHTLYLPVLEWLNVKTTWLQNTWQCFDPQARSWGAVRQAVQYCRRLLVSTRVYSYPAALRGSGVVFSTTLLFGSTADSSVGNHVELKDRRRMHARQADNDIRGKTEGGLRCRPEGQK